GDRQALPGHLLSAEFELQLTGWRRSSETHPTLGCWKQSLWKSEIAQNTPAMGSVGVAAHNQRRSGASLQVELMAITETRKRLNRKFTWVVREGITKCLRKHGLSQRGRHYWRDCDPTVAFAIYVGKGPQWSEDECTFHIYCGMVTNVVPVIFENLAVKWMPEA